MSIRLQELMSEERLDQGYVIILPGIEGRSFFNRSVARGLADAGVPYGIEIYDWTYRWPLFLYNLRSGRLHRQQARRIAERIITYRAGHPAQPVYLIGHSGGGAISLLSLEELPADLSVTGAILLGCALSPLFDLERALQRTHRGIWNVSSIGDLLFIAFGTMLFGTVDSKHSISAGLLGFDTSDLDESLRRKLHEVPFRGEFLRTRNFAGHFGYTARPFVKQYLAPILLTDGSF